VTRSESSLALEDEANIVRHAIHLARVPVVPARRAGSVPTCRASFAAVALVACRRRGTAPVT